MTKEEVKLTGQQYEIVKLISRAKEGVKVSNIAKELDVTLQKVNGSIRGLTRKGVIEADEESDPHSPTYWLCPTVEIEEKDGEQGKMKVYIRSAVGTGIGIEGEGGIGEGKEFSTIEEYIKFKGLEGIDDLKRKQLEEWLQTYNVGRQPKNVVLRQYETNPQVKYTRRGLYDALRRAGVKEDFSTGIVEQVFIIEDQYAPYLPDFDRDLLIQRKNPNAVQQSRWGPFLEEDRFREPTIHRRDFFEGERFREPNIKKMNDVPETRRRQDRLKSETLDGETIRDIVRNELRLRQRDDGGDSGYQSPYRRMGVEGPQRLGLGQFEMVEEPFLDERGNPRRDGKGNIIYRKRYVRTDKEERVEKEWRDRYEDLQKQFTELEKRFGNSQMKSEIDYLKGKLEAIENRPPSELSPELSVELAKIEHSSKVLEDLLSNVTSLAKAHMGIEEGTRVGLTDQEIEELGKKRAAEEK